MLFKHFGKRLLFLFSFLFSLQLVSTESSYQFLVIGDFGEKGEFYQTALSKIIAIYKNEIDFVVTTGDNFYPNGVTNPKDEHFHLSFESIYRDISPINWYITLGNHDHRGSIQALKEYATLNKNWIFPDSFYSFSKIENEFSSQFVVTDTSPFLRYLWIFPLKIKYLFGNQKQLGWLDKQTKPEANWKFVFGHHPIFSGGTHSDTEELKKKFLKILKKNKVDIYFSGHDHDLQVLKDSDSDILFVVSGGGSKFRIGNHHEKHLFKKYMPGFVLVRVFKTMCSLRFIGLENQILYEMNLHK
jgi:3',5'-cyclic AMP phosphodiesterase CpdA